MNILVPYVGAQLDRIIDAGADEIYFGFHDQEWTDLFGEYTNLNRMSDFGEKANPLSFEEALITIRDIKRKGKEAFIALNANGYSKDCLEFIKDKYFPQLKEVGVSGLIVSSLNLAREVVDHGLNPVASTMCGIYNKDIAQAYHDSGMRRFIVPRDLSLGEIYDIIKYFPEDEFEAFLMRNGCVFSDTYCLGMHRKECKGATCSYLKFEPKTFITPSKNFDEKQKINLNDMLYNERLHVHTCGLCAIYRLKEAGVTSLKIVGRSDHPGRVVSDIRLIKRNLNIVDGCGSEEEFLEKMEFPSDSSRQCLRGLNCYYPEIRFG